MAAATAIATGIAGCGPTTTNADGAADVDATVATDAYVGGFDAAYGAPPPDASAPDALEAPDAYVGGFDAAYGAPPPDASAPDATSALDAGVDTGAPVAAYGAPAPDAG